MSSPEKIKGWCWQRCVALPKLRPMHCTALPRASSCGCVLCVVWFWNSKITEPWFLQQNHSKLCTTQRWNDDTQKKSGDRKWNEKKRLRDFGKGKQTNKHSCHHHTRITVSKYSSFSTQPYFIGSNTYSL